MSRLARCNTALVKARAERELSQGEVASQVGISRTYYNQIENGTRVPSLVVSQTIAAFFGKPTDELFPPEKRLDGRARRRPPVERDETSAATQGKGGVSGAACSGS